MKLNESKGNLRISAILTTDAIYFTGPSFRMPAALAHKWIKIPLGEMGSGTAAATLTSGLRYLNPVPQAQLLIAAEHVRALGTASVGGVTTTKYTGWFTPSVAVKYLSASLRRGLWPVLKHISGNVGFKVWIDGQHRIRQFTEVEHWGGTVTITSRFSGFNVPVHITLPTASEVVTPPASAVSGTGTKIGS